MPPRGCAVCGGGRIPIGASSSCRVAGTREQGGRTMTNSSKRALRWVAPVTLVGAMGLVACGDGGSDETVRTASRSEVALGSDEHLVNLSEEIAGQVRSDRRSEEHTSELQSLMRISYAVFCLKKKKIKNVQEKMNITSRKVRYDTH